MLDANTAPALATPAAFTPATPIAPAFEIGATVSPEPWQAAWLTEKLDGIAKRARRSGVDASPRLVAMGDSYPMWRTCATEVARDPYGFCIAVDIAQGQKCEPGVCPCHWEEYLMQDFRV